MTKVCYRHCKSYVLVVEVDSSELEDAKEVLELVLKLAALVNDHTLRTAFVDDKYDDTVSNEIIVI